MISEICHVLNYLSNSTIGNLPFYVVFSPALLILIPLVTVDKDYWKRIDGRKYLAVFLLFDFINYPATTITVIFSTMLFISIGYMHRYCIVVF